MLTSAYMLDCMALMLHSEVSHGCFDKVYEHNKHEMPDCIIIIIIKLFNILHIFSYSLCLY